jgi:hypothetical protein
MAALAVPYWRALVVDGHPADMAGFDNDAHATGWGHFRRR